MKTKKEHLAMVVAALERYSQRATYGAVGGIVGLPARSVMQGEARNHRNSWVVSIQKGEPSGYSEKDWAPLLKANPEVIQSPIELAKWLKAHS